MAILFFPGTDAVIKLDNSGGTPTDISDGVSTATLDVTYQNGQFYTFGLTGAQVTEGQRTFSGTLGIRSSETNDTSQAYYIASTWLVPGAGVKAGARTLIVDYPDSTAGSYRLSGESRATSFALINSDAGGDGTPATHNLAFNIDGDMTLTIIV